jgi:uncharacterized caspase-like protein
VSAHHGRERLLVAVADKAIEQLAVAALGSRQFGEIAAIQNPQDRVSHSLLSSKVFTYYLLSAERQFDTLVETMPRNRGQLTATLTRR